MKMIKKTAVMVIIAVISLSLVSCREEIKEEKPIFKAACISDLHIDYGIEKAPPYMRLSSLNALGKIAEEDADLLIIGGDITSANGTTWDLNDFMNVKRAVTENAAASLRSRRVAYISGNHEYDAFGSLYDSGDYSDIMQADIGNFTSCLYQKEYPGHLLAFTYDFGEVSFLGINTPLGNASNIQSIPDETFSFVKEELLKIGSEKPIIAAIHYPLSDSNGITDASHTLAESEKLKEILLPYHNLYLVYGHNHGGKNAPFSNSVSERITAYSQSGENAPESYDGFLSCFMGSFSYHRNSADEDWLSEKDPKIVQALIISIYEDRAEFQVKNYGEVSGGSWDIEPFTVKR